MSNRNWSQTRNDNFHNHFLPLVGILMFALVALTFAAFLLSHHAGIAVPTDAQWHQAIVQHYTVPNYTPQTAHLDTFTASK